MIRYHFTVTMQGIKTKVHQNARNPQSAYSKVKRLYPLAERIHLIRSDKISEY
jgi:hypothetical protein